MKINNCESKKFNVTKWIYVLLIIAKRILLENKNLD